MFKFTCSTPLLVGLESGTIARVATMSTFEINFHSAYCTTNKKKLKHSNSLYNRT